MKGISGIYEIQSKHNPSRCYIGSSVNLRKRKYGHFNELRRNKHGNIRLQNHFNKYGEADLLFTILIYCGVDTLIECEQEYIDLYDPFFNIAKVAGNCTGVPCSLEKRKKLRQAQTGRIHTEEYKKKMSEILKQRILSEEHKRKIGLSKLGKKRPPKICLLMSERMKGRIPWNKGRKFTDEEKLKHNIKNPTHKFSEGERNCNAKLNRQKIDEAIVLRQNGMTLRKIAEIMGVSRPAITFAINGKTWKIPEP